MCYAAPTPGSIVQGRTGGLSHAASASFGDLLRQQRLAVGLTQEALAEQAGLSVHGIQKLESGGSHPYRDTVRRLVQALRLSPVDLEAFQNAAAPAPRHRADGSGRPSTNVRKDLPTALTSFIGREDEKDELVRLLPSTRLLTLTGVGGCGKTRLALEVARLLYASYPDGVWLVELAPIADPALVPQTVASALGIRETPAQPLVNTLTTALKRHRSLLLLDNCEHLLNACARLANTLLQACPELHILTTSREALGLAGEVSRRVPSLPVPPLEPPPTANALGAYAAVQLLVERTRAVQPGFDVTEGNAVAIARICHRLDGIPLALELAAARARGLSVHDLAARLDQRFRLLTGGSRAALPRQQTLQATIDWSYDLLSQSERVVFARLSVFAGGWDLEAAEAVCPGAGIEQDQVVELLLHLVDKSLVAAEQDATGAQRYHLLDTLRQYGRARLLASGRPDAIHGRHAAYYLTLAERAEPELDLPRQAVWIERLALEHSNLRSALEWLMAQGEVERALHLAGVLSRFREVRGHVREGRARLAAVLALAGESPPTLARARVLDGAGVLAFYQADVPAAGGLFKASLAVYRQHQQRRGAGWALIHLGWLCHDTGRWRAARRLLQEALVACRDVDDRRGVARCLTLLGMLGLNEGDLIIARSFLEQSLALNRDVGDRWGTAWALHNLGRVLLADAELGQADAQSAQPVLEESVATWREIGERRHLAFAVADLAITAAWLGDLELARIQLGESLTTFTELEDGGGKLQALFNCARLFATEGQYEQSVRVLGASFEVSGAAQGTHVSLTRSIVERRLESARSIIGPELVAAAWSGGRAMSIDAAVAYAQQQLVASVSAV
jgi:predicted ATPase/DNA-binding XRE family transcriptional regulator